jgi:hypothetical protein
MDARWWYLWRLLENGRVGQCCPVWAALGKGVEGKCEKAYEIGAASQNLKRLDLDDSASFFKR